MNSSKRPNPQQPHFVVKVALLPKMGFGELELCLPSPMFGRGAGGEGKDLSLHWDAPVEGALLSGLAATDEINNQLRHLSLDNVNFGNVFTRSSHLSLD